MIGVTLKLADFNRLQPIPTTLNRCPFRYTLNHALHGH
jgi:hypothetical protein